MDKIISPFFFDFRDPECYLVVINKNKDVLTVRIFWKTLAFFVNFYISGSGNVDNFIPVFSIKTEHKTRPVKLFR